MVRNCFIFLLVLSSAVCQGQNTFTKEDTLRGSVTPERAWWDLQHYNLFVEMDPTRKWISGSNTVSYKVLKPGKVMQIDLQAPLTITSVVQGGDTLAHYNIGPAYFIRLLKMQKKDDENQIVINYEGYPQEALNAPWDGGISWSTDDNGKPFIATSCQGLGASVWWPCKDHMYDEPDNGVVLSAKVPKGLIAVSNGRLVEENSNSDSTRTFTWKVESPINNYGVNLNIGDYIHFSEKYQGVAGTLDMDYWVLSYNEEKAKVHFKDAPRMMAAFEDWFGPYPFYEDGYKLVEVPYLGMEHQSSVTYGNGYQMGYEGRDLSGTGWGLKFDFIIVHESGHEWFANSITNKDAADMWIHEGFTSYSESIFIEYYYGKEAAEEYVRGTRSLIENKYPLISNYGVNEDSKDSDMYFKGSNMLLTLRQWVNDDKKWKSMFKAINTEFYHKTVTTHEIESFIACYFDLDLKPFFDQYLRDIRIPVLQYQFIENTMVYRWDECVPNFNMPIRINLNGEEVELMFKDGKGQIDLKQEETSFSVNLNYYVFSTIILK